ncbi:MAG: pyrroline-5-carboxylate reductase [Alphaproteobacteria bacterium]|nr:pyrroline-5-carboxylate reductase [Alphaproteobacteria bacterium]
MAASAAPILLIGAGRMGGALLRGWQARGIGPLMVVEPNPGASLLALARSANIRVIGGAAQAPERLRACVIAIKPQILRTEAAHLAPIARTGTLMLSIAAGTSIATLRKHFGRSARIIRAMPNTPGAIGQGISSLYAPAAIAPRERKLAQSLLAPLGETVWVNKEALIDATTAVSGSGPAYVFYLVEALAEAGRAIGLPQAIAEQLARATIMGAGALLAADARPPEALRRDVTSPGGTTEAALKVLMADDGLAQLMRAAVAAANRRAKELAG